MKKLFILALILWLMVVVRIVFADCTIGVAWTPDPAQSAITEQQVWFNPDGVVNNGDEIMKAGSLGASVNQYDWTDAGVNCPASAAVYINTIYLGGIEVKSAEVNADNVVGAILSIAVKHQQ